MLLQPLGTTAANASEAEAEGPPRSLFELADKESVT